MLNETWCETCGVHTRNLVKILEFKTDKILSVCIGCSDVVRETNLVLKGIGKEIQIQNEISKLKNIKNRRLIREEAEKMVYGKVKMNKREIISEKDKELIFDKFKNKCVICGTEEGLHIHHKDHNPTNNEIENLILLCGICHKKIHMKVR